MELMPIAPEGTYRVYRSQSTHSDIVQKTTEEDIYSTHVTRFEFL